MIPYTVLELEVLLLILYRITVVDQDFTKEYPRNLPVVACLPRLAYISLVTQDSQDFPSSPPCLDLPCFLNPVTLNITNLFHT